MFTVLGFFLPIFFCFGLNNVELYYDDDRGVVTCGMLSLVEVVMGNEVYIPLRNMS